MDLNIKYKPIMLFTGLETVLETQYQQFMM
jgi:hypothetical protein